MCRVMSVPVRMDDDDFGGFEAAETFDCGEAAAQAPVFPAIPWVAFSSVPGLSAPPDILLDQRPSKQADCPDAGPPRSPPEQTHHCGDASAAGQDSGAGGPEGGAQPPQSLSSLMAKLTASEEEKACIQKELEQLMEKHSAWELQHHEEKQADAEVHRKRYAELQEKHNKALEDMRKAGHESLTIIVEEFKALTMSAVQQQLEVREKCLEAAMDKQREKCEELLNTQHQRLLDILDAERDALEEKLKETLSQQGQHQKELLEKCVEEEKQRAQEAVEAAVKAQEERMKEAVLEAVQEERRRAEKQWVDQRSEWEAERRRDREELAKAIQEALVDQRRISKESVKEAIAEERQAGERRLEEATLKVQNELMDFMKEQKRLDQALRQRHLSSLELFLSCAQRQLSTLMGDGDVDASKSLVSAAEEPAL
ncbi:coiled-coil domain-containing protein 91-like isoform X1 [Scleropages formosus]|uniref:Coiled-coil domain-containing protein 91-like n=4 Tax=Scleropages formosus TaxID=113540 RepID=A0A8C9RMQ5_SCLFO|nr:coiled-coil domain-containing protein 91-like isoform X1 [Scleropages formosus]